MNKISNILTLLLTTILSTFIASGQSPKVIKDSTNLKAIRGFRGETLLIQLDTAYVLNKFSFMTFNKAYEKKNEIDSTTRELLNKYEKLVLMSEDELKNKDFFYNQLLQQFKNLSDTSSILINQYVTKIKDVTTTLDKATTDITLAKQALSETQRLLAKERMNIFKRDLGIGVGSIAVGILLGLVLSK